MGFSSASVPDAWAFSQPQSEQGPDPSYPAREEASGEQVARHGSRVAVPSEPMQESEF